MVDWRDVPLVRGLFLPNCRSITKRSIPFAIVYSSPFILLFSYYSTHNMLPMKKWNVRLLSRDFLVGWSLCIAYITLRTLLLDPYCDPYSLHYSKELSAFQRKKQVLDAMQGIMESEGRGKPRSS